MLKENKIKARKRDQKKKREMNVSGKSVFRLKKLINKKSQKASRKNP